MASKIVTFVPPPAFPNTAGDTMWLETTDRYLVPAVINRDTLDRDAGGRALGADLQVGDWVCTDSLGLSHQKIASIEDPE